MVVILLGPLVWLALLYFLKHSVQGRRIRAATQDRDMLDALGVNPRPLMMGVVVLGCALAGLGGALQLPREPATLQMDVNVVVETFVVVVMGGLGSITGAFLAALLIGLVHSFGTEFFPQSSLVLVFLTMGVVLALRPYGLMGEKAQSAPREPAQRFVRGPDSQGGLVLILLAVVLVCAVAFAASGYWRSIATDALILLVFGLSLQVMMALGGLVSFGHAAFFALGAYGTALAHVHWQAGVWAAMAMGVGLALVVATVFGAAVVRSSGVYLAMLSLALAQVVWALASQWVGVTGGDNGLIGLNLVRPDSRAAFEGAVLVLALVGLLALRRLAGSPFGMALQAVRDVPQRAAASGLAVNRLKYQVFVGSAAWAGLAGGLFAAHKGAVFPSAASVATSVDALLVVLLGGVHQLWGVLAGSVMLTLASAELGRHFEYWRGLLGLLIMGIMVWSPTGLLGLWGRLGQFNRQRPA
jgi:branched-chain amino acid transport system permease protein